MIAKLEWTKMHNKTKTNTELPQTMGSTLNNLLTTTEPQPKPSGGGGLNAFYWSKIFALDYMLLLKFGYGMSHAYQNKDQHRTPTNNGRYIKQYINNNRTTALKCTAA